MDHAYEMLFEMTMRMFLGDNAYQTAGQVNNEKHRKEWYRKSLTQIVKRVQEIDTTTGHKESMAHYAERALVALSERPFNETKLSILLLSLVGSLLGFVTTGTIPVYLRTFRTEAVSKRTDVVDLTRVYHENSVSVRRRIANQLGEEGLNDFQIALVLNTSEYQVKKLSCCLSRSSAPITCSSNVAQSGSRGFFSPGPHHPACGSAPGGSQR